MGNFVFFVVGSLSKMEAVFIGQCKAGDMSVLNGYRSAELNQRGFLAACQSGKLDLVQGLIANYGVDVNARNSRGRTGLALAIRARKSNVAAFLLPTDEIALKTKVDRTGSVFHVCAQAGEEEILRLLLERFLRSSVAKTAFETTNSMGMTALMLAVQSGHAGCTLRLLDAGANPARVTPVTWRTSLHIATRYLADMCIVKALVAYGAPIYQTDKRQKTAIDYADEKTRAWVQGYRSRLRKAREATLTLLAISKFKSRTPGCWAASIPRDVWTMIAQQLWLGRVDD